MLEEEEMREKNLLYFHTSTLTSWAAYTRSVLHSLHGQSTQTVCEEIVSFVLCIPTNRRPFSYYIKKKPYYASFFHSTHIFSC